MQAKSIRVRLVKSREDRSSPLLRKYWKLGHLQSNSKTATIRTSDLEAGVVRELPLPYGLMGANPHFSSLAGARPFGLEILHDSKDADVEYVLTY